MRLSQVSRNLTKLLDIKSLKLLDNYAQFNPSPLSMKQMLEFGRTATEVESYQVINGNYSIHHCGQKLLQLQPHNLYHKLACKFH